MPTQFKLAYYGIVRNQKGQVLVLQRPGHGHFAGKWELPGGKPEPGESPEAAVAREAKEEASIVIEAQRLAGAAEFEIPGKTFHGVMVIFECSWRGGQRIVLSSEHQKDEWVDWATLREMDLTPGLRRFVDSCPQGSPG